MKNQFLVILAAAVITFGLFTLMNLGSESLEPKVETPPRETQPESSAATSYLDATYIIEGEAVTLQDGLAEEVVATSSSATVFTQHFGNEFVTDLDGDGDEDITFVLTQETGGSGVFYYAVAALKTESGYVGSDGYLLGDRIAPQSTTLSPNPRHVNVVVFNYAERAEGEPFTTPPSVGQSAYLKITPETNRWGVVLPDFEGESAL